MSFTIKWSVLHRRILAALAGTWLLVGSLLPLVAADSLPYPRELVLKVEFWKGIYTKYNTHQGVLHDAEDLSIIYDAIEVPRQSDTWEIENLRSQIREHLFNILRKKGENLTVEERKVLSKFPPNTTRSRLLQATENIRFQLGQSDRFREGILRSGLYMKHIERILKEEGAPDFLKFLPHVESSFQENAMSKFGAAGLWQLMPSTGKLFIKVDYAIDQRLDPLFATRAAAKYLKGDYEKLGAWPLALTAYNHGAGGVMRAVQTLGTTDIAEIAFRYTSPSFGFASRNFYAQFLAAADVASHYKKYFGDLQIPPPISFDTVVLNKATYYEDFIQGYRFKNDEFKKLNPSLREPLLLNRRPIPAGTMIRVPVNSRRMPVLVASADKKVLHGQLTAARTKKIPVLMAPKVEKPVLVKEVKEPVSKYAIHDVADGKGWVNVEMNETISQIAEWLKVNSDELRQWNGMDAQGQARLGQRLLVKLETVSVSDFNSIREDYHRKIREDFFSQYEVLRTVDYEVKRGENLWSLCYQKFDIPPWLLEEYNPKVPMSSLGAGMKLKIPVLQEKEGAALVSSVSNN